MCCMSTSQNWTSHSERWEEEGGKGGERRRKRREGEKGPEEREKEKGEEEVGQALCTT